LTICVVWGAFQFHKYDYKAPWLAYAAMLMPMAYMVAGLMLTEGLPHQFDALALR
jgi:hypothetical protein